MPNIQEVLLLNGRAIGAFPSSGGGIRYDEENDVIQLYYNGQWVDWKSGGMAYPVGTETIFNYREQVEQFVIPATGIWKLEVWGAQGGTVNGTGGKGGYATGKINFESGDEIYVCVGGRTGSSGYNGGGSCAGGGGIGGGATHIGLTNNVLKNTLPEDVLIVGGGGGGGSKAGNASANGGAGGGLSGSAGSDAWYQSTYRGGGGGGGTQSAGGAGGRWDAGSSGLWGQGGSYGQGGSMTDHVYCGAGGGGYYGGGTGGVEIQYNVPGGGGGGSSYMKSTLTDVSTTAGQREGAGQAKLTYLGISA